MLSQNRNNLPLLGTQQRGQISCALIAENFGERVLFRSVKERQSGWEDACWKRFAESAGRIVCELKRRQSRISAKVTFSNILFSVYVKGKGILVECSCEIIGCLRHVPLIKSRVCIYVNK